MPLVTTILRIWLKFREYKRVFRQAQGSPFYGDYDDSRNETESKGGWTYPLRRKKKVYSKDDGEYVSFKEVKITSTTSEPIYRETVDGTRPSDAGQRVADAEWEEL